MTALFGTAAACLGLIAWAAFSWGEQPTALVLAGGTIGVTIAFNVPLNNRLATLHPQGSGAVNQLGGVRHKVDRVEPLAGRSGPRGGGLAHHCAPCWVSVQCRIPAHNDSSRNPMSRTPIETMSPEAIRPTALG